MPQTASPGKPMWTSRIPSMMAETVVTDSVQKLVGDLACLKQPLESYSQVRQNLVGDLACLKQPLESYSQVRQKLVGDLACLKQPLESYSQVRQKLVGDLACLKRTILKSSFSGDTRQIW